MAWSTSQLAELAGTTVKAVRHYHSIGLLEEPERTSNGYKQYDVGHLVRLLRIKRLADLDVPLAQIATLGQASEKPEEALRLLDAELEASIERLQKVRVELAMVLRHQAATDLPSGFGAVADKLSEADRALILVYSRVFSPEAMDDMKTMLEEESRTTDDDEFDALTVDADEDTRQRLAGAFLRQVRASEANYPWLENPAAYAVRGEAFAGHVIGQALGNLYNTAQIDVMVRLNALMETQKGTEDAK